MLQSGKDKLSQLPSWNGEQAAWADYVRQCRLAYETRDRKKRRFLGPKLAMKYLLLYLQDRLGMTSIPASGQKLEALLIKLQRHHGESFATWSTRVMEAYKNAQRSLAMVREDVNGRPERKGSSVKARSHDGDAGSAKGTTSEPQQDPPSPVQATAAPTSPVAQPAMPDPWQDDEWTCSWNQWQWRDWGRPGDKTVRKNQMQVTMVQIIATGWT